jgi:hypothetical protein
MPLNATSLPDMRWIAALGQVSGIAGTVYKFGAIPDIDSGETEQTVWDETGLYAYLGAASVLKISSSDDTDDKPGQAGALTVQIYGCDGNYALINEVVALNGNTPVNTVNSYLRVWRMIVRSAGANGVESGDIYAGTGDVTNGVPAVKYAKILAGNSQTLMALYTIPANMYGLMLQWGGTSRKNEDANLRLKFRPLGEVFQLKSTMAIVAQAHHTTFEVPYLIDSKTDIEVRTTTATNNSEIGADFSLLLIDK